ncbi:MAG: hypothetical protein IKO21_05975 [Fibrobacter sp.]|jgi:hypothetical protein|nr:hypothetical protein [Fibrobacter sp.]MBR4559097.1 hypothetical protein [Fibrobacter sp.]
MTNAAFADLESQVEELPLFQIIVLRQKLDNILEERKAERDVSVGLALLDEIAGSVDREIDFKKEREASRDPE